VDWYYVQDGKRMGPVDEKEFYSLVNGGVIDSERLVWRKGMTQWQRYADVMAQKDAAGQAQARQGAKAVLYKCAECGKSFPADEMVRYGESTVCATCKPIFFQRLKEGAPLHSTMYYGGFWIRFLAKMVDWLVLVVANVLIQFGFTMTTLLRVEPGKPPGPAFIAIWTVMMLVQFGIAISYATFFVGKFAATPGKMVCNLKIVTADGGRVSYPRALARYFAEILSGLILMLGYIMAAVDEEKRALHDRICDTRVIRK
jgi:uncharacterized RDD family membrane protein YckC